jgi:hypothetical protein
MFGRSFNGFKNFSDILVGIGNGQTSEEVKKVWKEFKEIILSEINARTLVTKQKQEQRLNRRKQMEQLRPRNQVMIVNTMRESKWEPIYEGPFEIEQ